MMHTQISSNGQSILHEQTLSNEQIVDKQQQFTWKWSTGIPYKKSERIVQNNSSKNSENSNIIPHINHFTETDLFINSIPNKNTLDYVDDTPSKREEQNEKLSKRHLIMQKSVNPFIQSNNYTEDIHTEATLLRPKDSNM